MTDSIPIPSRNEIPADVLKELDKYPPINIYTVLAYSPPLCKPWMDLIHGIYASGLNNRIREIGICRIAYLTNSAYEAHQHHFIALQNGVTEKEYQIIMKETPVQSLDDEGNFICKLVDELEHTATISKGTFDQLQKRYPIKDIVAMCVTFNTYNAVGRIANMLRLPIEASNPLKNFSGFAEK